MYNNHIVLKLEFHFEDDYGYINRSAVCHREYWVDRDSHLREKEVKARCDDFFSRTYETLSARIDKIIEDAKRYPDLKRYLDDLGYIQGKLSLSCTCGVGESNGGTYESSRYAHNQNYMSPNADRIRSILDDIHKDAEGFALREVMID